MIFFIYKITNRLNNKVYIGQTRNPTRRWGDHKYLGKLKTSHTHLYRAMYQYGVENFSFESLVATKDQLHIDELEVEFIKNYNATNRDFGYNLEGGGHKRKIVSDETRKILAESKMGEKNPRYGKKTNHSEETKRKIGEGRKGKLHSIETIEKLRALNIGRPCSSHVKIILSEKNSGKPWTEARRNAQTEEVRQKMSAAKKGKPSNRLGSKTGPLSEDHKKKLSIAHKGKYTGENASGAKLTWAQVREMRRLFAEGKATRKELAAIFGIAHSTAREIISNRTWKE